MTNNIDNKRNYPVVKANDLIQKAKYSLTPTQQKLISYVVSMIKPTDTAFQKYDISVSDFCKLCGINKDYFYSDFKEIIDDLDNKAFWVRLNGKRFKFRWFLKAEYIEGKGKVRIMLDDDLQPYLLNLQKNFTTYELLNILPLKSKYSIRLYELLKSYAYLGIKVFDLEELKELLDASNYEYKNFSRRILEKTKEEINHYTDINIEYEAIKAGRKVVGIKFTMKEKQLLERYAASCSAREKLDN